MENRPTIRIRTSRVQSEYEDRFNNWIIEAYHPLLITVPGYTGFDDYKIVKENPQYERYLSINYYENRMEQIKIRNNQKVIDVTRDLNTWGNRAEMTWYPAYELMMNFRKEEKDLAENGLLRIEKAPIMHIEGYSLSPDDEEKFGTWFAKWGYGLYIPLLMKLPGLKEYSWYKFIDVDVNGLPDIFKVKRPVQYPSYLSILHFDGINTYENYERSMELAGFRDHMKVPFPAGLDFKWYVQYQLVKSWRK
jgi:hypothetical protein